MRDIPGWLAHLRRDRRGLPVPYINRWGLVDDTSKVSIKIDRPAGGLAVFYDDSDQDVPDFTRQNMQRQRECMIGGLCQVCRRPIPWSRRFLVLSDMSVERITLGHQPVTVVTEPWLDSWCAEYAVNVCPALIRRSRDEHLTVQPITSKGQVQMVMSTGWVEGPLEAESKRVQPIMWAKLMIPFVVAVEVGTS